MRPSDRDRRRNDLLAASDDTLLQNGHLRCERPASLAHRRNVTVILLDRPLMHFHYGQLQLTDVKG